MAHPDDPQRALTGDTTDAPEDNRLPQSAAPSKPPGLRPRTIAIIAFGAVIACLLGYLASAVPGRWFPAVDERSFGVAQLSMPRGTAAVSRSEMVVTKAADDGNTVISVTTDFRATDYPVVAWIAAGFPADARVALLWRTDVEPSRVNKRPLETDAGQLLPANMHDDPHWIGRIAGLALVIQGPIDGAPRIRGVIAKPAGALETLRDRVREWLAPEPWNGASINTVAGGADVQRLPLPMLIAATLVLVALVASLLLRRQRRAMQYGVATAVLAVALAGWFVLDARWTFNLVRQAQATASRYAGKDSAGKHLAGEDRDLFAFVEKARALLPASPARVFVVADADYFRGRAAYHLYPQNVWFDPYRNSVPPAGQLHAGDWLVVYQRRGVQYDAARRSLRWDGDVTVPVDLKLLDHGGALFVVR